MQVVKKINIPAKMSTVFSRVLILFFFLVLTGSMIERFENTTSPVIKESRAASNELTDSKLDIPGLISYQAILNKINVQLPVSVQERIPVLLAFLWTLLVLQNLSRTNYVLIVRNHHFTHQAICWTRGLNRGQPFPSFL